MGRYIGPKDKISRREGFDLFGRDKEALQRRLKQRPGEHGHKSKRMSQYGRQLREKQKVKFMYGMREKQFINFFKTALQEAKNNPNVTTGDALLKLLERRLDNVVYRLGLAKTRPQARQFVTQGKVLVNSKQVSIPSYLVEPGQTVTLLSEMFKNPMVQENLKNVMEIPAWLDVKEGKGHILREPEREEIGQLIDENLIVEFYRTIR